MYICHMGQIDRSGDMHVNNEYIHAWLAL